ncbi:Solute carrier family 35 member F5 [Blattella germanica]|nr:Solute carrier family 35 member F5 [Blattella germanica]
MTVVSIEFPGGGMLNNKSQRLLLGLFVLLLVDIIWVSSSELTKYIYQNEHFEKPFFSTYVKTSMFTLYLLGFCFWSPWRDQCSKPTAYMSDPTFVPIKFPDPSDRSSGTESDDSSVKSVRFSKLAEVRHMSESDATEALLARLSYQASIRAGEVARRAASKFSIQKIALKETEAGVVNVLSSTCSLFTLTLAALFPSSLGDRFTVSKLVAVLVCLSDLKIEAKVPMGAILALVSAFFYATYLVFLQRKVDNEDKMDIPMFFGFVGLFNLLLLWPLFFILHYSKWELFEWPTKGCFLTSSLVATVAISLTIPMTMFADIVFKKVVDYPFMFYIGAVPMFLAFFAVTLLVHYENWDPVLEGIRRCYIFLFRRGRQVRLSDIEDEQTESLMGINSGDHEA